MAERRPIKIVIPRMEDMHPPHPGGSTKIFPTADGFVENLEKQINRVELAFSANFKAAIALPAVAKVTLRREAMAKSHRPTEIFNQKTCPIIGSQNFGELLVRVDPNGLNQLRREIHRTTSAARAAVSTIQAIEPFVARSAISPNRDPRQPVKVRLLNHRNQSLNASITAAFTSLVRSLTKSEPARLVYAAGLRLFKVLNVTADAAMAMAGFVGVQEVSEIPGYGVETQAIYVGQATKESLPPPESGVDYPIVGLLDSGTDRDNPLLQAWVVDRWEDDIPPSDQDNLHGSFIAGLLANGRGLNHNDPRFPAGRCKILDAVVIPKRGGAPHPEDELLKTIRKVIDRYHQQVKVWNLSISAVESACCDDRFSDFAIALDEIQDQYEVTIVTCTGNTARDHYRAWPPGSAGLGESDRMYPAADSVRAISVASLAHLHRHDSLSQSEHPSPFSRRGPGPAFLPKPDLSHYGGNCAADGSFQQTGILSVDHTGLITERIGTSYASPLVAKSLAILRDNVAKPISRNLAKALLIQSAAMNRGPLVAEELRYRGFGVPGHVESLLNCEPWQATLIFEPEFDPERRIFDRQSFPIPQCFRKSGGKVSGEFLMTLAYDPPLDPDATAEYCRVNVDVSLGTYNLGKDGKRKHKGLVPLEPVDAKHLYEKYQIEHGFKWSPVKVYRGIVEEEIGDMWRIFLRLIFRSPDEAESPQNVALVVTMMDPERKDDRVYNEVVQEMNRNGWATENLEIRERPRIGGRP